MQASIGPSVYLLDQIRSVFEGLTLTVKGDTGGHQEIGYGHDLSPIERYPDGITLQFAELLLDEDMERCSEAVSKLGWTLNQGKVDALLDFTYECGAEALRELAAHGQDQVPAQLPRWIHANVDGKETVLPGMVKRRAAEVSWWNTVDPVAPGK